MRGTVIRNGLLLILTIAVIKLFCNNPRTVIETLITMVFSALDLQPTAILLGNHEFLPREKIAQNSLAGQE